MKKKPMFFRFLPKDFFKLLRIMRKIILLIMVFTTTIFTRTYAQDVVNVVNKNISIRDVLREIQEQTKYSFIYNDEYKELKTINDVQFQNQTVPFILDQLFTNTNLTFKIIDNNLVVITPRDQNPIEITGTVVDENGDVLVGAHVIEQGANNITTTDANGAYNIIVSHPDAILLFSFIGYYSQSIEVNNTQEINVVLIQESLFIQEVYCTGYQTISRERATGSYAVIETETLEKKLTRNIMDKLLGTTTGILAPDGSIVDDEGRINVIIRGRGTFARETMKPLIVLDGYPIESNLRTINPNDVKRITVLKDAAAASIWGARASNGVIVIETKEGRFNDDLRVNASVSYNLTPLPKMSKFDRADNESLFEFYRHIVDNDFLETPEYYDGYFAGNYAYNEMVDTYLKYKNGEISEEEVAEVENRLKDINSRNEFKRLFLQNMLRQNFNVSLSGGTHKTNYYVSSLYSMNRGHGINNNGNDLNLNIKINTELAKWLKFSTGVTIQNDWSKNNGIGLNLISDLPQFQRILDENGNYVNQPQGYYSPFKDELVAQGYPYRWDYNLMEEFRNRNNAHKGNHIRTDASLNFRLFDGFNVETSIMYETSNVSREDLYNENTYRTRNFVNRRTYIDSNGEVISSIPEGEIYSIGEYKLNSLTSRNIVRYTKDFSEDQSLTALAGLELRTSNASSFSTERYGFHSGAWTYQTVDFKTPLPHAFGSYRSRISDPTIFSLEENRFLSYFGNVGYSLMLKYDFTFSIRLDKTNFIGAAPRYREVPLWSGGFKWRLSNEDFFNASYVDDLSLRATYGYTANAPKGSSPYTILGMRNNYYNGNSQAYILSPGNPELTWEKSSTTNFGLDYSLFHYRLNGSIEYYNKNSTGLLRYIVVNPTYGVSNALLNYAAINNQGIEAVIDATIIETEFEWNSSFMFSYNKNKVTKIESRGDDSFYDLSSRSKPLLGHSLDYVYAVRWGGLDDQGVPYALNKDGEIVTAEDFNYMEDIDDLVYLGTETAPYYGSWNNDFSYKGFSLSIVFNYQAGHIFRKNTLSYGLYNMFDQPGVNYISRFYNDRWQNPGDESKTEIPRLPVDYNELYNFDDVVNNTDVLIANASHIRLQEISLSYQLPKNIVQKVGIGSATLTGQISGDLWVKAFNEGNIDPLNQIRPDEIPPFRVYSLALNVSF
jgi:TonB-dependent starch-binding outer membrane protein SusC